MSTIPIDASIGPELIEFWANKYKEAKDELDTLKLPSRLGCLQKGATHDFVSKSDEILDVVRSIKSVIEVDTTLHLKLEAVTKEKDELAARLSQLEAQRDTLVTKVQLHLKQARSLSMEVNHHRCSALALLFPPVSFVAPSHQVPVLSFTDFTMIYIFWRAVWSSALVWWLTVSLTKLRIQFISRPPGSLPLYIPVLGQHGYWFGGPTEGPSHIAVEGRPNEWSYLGKYVSAPFVGGEMQLSEWMCLDEEVRSPRTSLLSSKLWVHKFKRIDSNGALLSLCRS
ncbi:hypothetical protein J3A83DRAFT_4375735 [Scleroderma citrinum]